MGGTRLVISWDTGGGRAEVECALGDKGKCLMSMGWDGSQPVLAKRRFARETIAMPRDFAAKYRIKPGSSARLGKRNAGDASGFSVHNLWTNWGRHIRQHTTELT
jgi:hypothetical protein